MCKIMCVTNRHICQEDFVERIEGIAKSGVEAIILREKDMTSEEYEALAGKVIDICAKNNTMCILHNFTHVADRLSWDAIHLPMGVLRSLDEAKRRSYRILGASCHSVDEAVEAESLGCTYITAGHVFVTDCKKGLEPRGVGFLGNVCKAVNIPVYGLGGINENNAPEVIEAGAEGVCIMSGFMSCPEPAEYIGRLTRKLRMDENE